MNQPQKISSQPSSEESQPLETVDEVCDEHGAYKAKVFQLGFGLKPRTSACPTCAEARRIEREKSDQAEAARVRRDRLARVTRESRIPARFAGKTLANYSASARDQSFALSACKAFVATWDETSKAGGSLVLLGAPGTGKTHLACAVASAVMEAHLCETLFSTVSEMLRHIKGSYNKAVEYTEQQAIDQFVSPALLILDEIGVQVGSEHEKLLMFEVLNTRYQECKPTILISNLNTDELETFMGQRIMDRYRECGAVIAFTWASHRGTQ